MKKIFVIYFVLFLSLLAQNPPTLRWAYKVANPDFELRESFIDNLENIYLHLWSIPNYFDDKLEKISSNGLLSYSIVDSLHRVCFHKSGPIYKYNWGTSSTLRKISPSGNLLWNKPQTVSFTQTDKYGNLYLGWKQQNQFIFAKYTSEVEPIWLTILENTDNIQELLFDENNNLLLNSFYEKNLGFYIEKPSTLIKLSLEGSILWTKKFEGDGIKILVNKYNDIYCVSSNHMYKYNSSGTELWNKTLNIVAIYTNWCLDKDGQVALVGFDQPNNEQYFYKLSENGNIDWRKPISNQKGLKIEFFLSNNDFYATQYKGEFNYKQYTLLKYNSNAELIWSYKIDTLIYGNNKIDKVFLGKNGLYITGASYGKEKYYNGYFIIALSDSSLVDKINEGETILSLFSLSQNYPNPFNPETTISYKIPAASKVSLIVYDVLGREVAILVNEYKQPGSYNSQFSIRNSQLPTGVYFYRLQSGSYSETKKMILLR
ncbi:MAG: T9SS type A sorting domain-containing protein [Ignavibacteria bacterium]|nr:T9SS type A sorting domain-containing protein [Ignavibacteria bacterium]